VLTAPSSSRRLWPAMSWRCSGDSIAPACWSGLARRHRHRAPGRHRRLRPHPLADADVHGGPERARARGRCHPGPAAARRRATVDPDSRLVIVEP